MVAVKLSTEDRVSKPRQGLWKNCKKRFKEVYLKSDAKTVESPNCLAAAAGSQHQEKNDTVKKTGMKRKSPRNKKMLRAPQNSKERVSEWLKDQDTSGTSEIHQNKLKADLEASEIGEEIVMNEGIANLFKTKLDNKSETTKAGEENVNNKKEIEEKTNVDSLSAHTLVSNHPQSECKRSSYGDSGLGDEESLNSVSDTQPSEARSSDCCDPSYLDSQRHDDTKPVCSEERSKPFQEDTSESKCKARLEKVSKRPLRISKSIKSKVVARKKSFHRFLLKNSHSGYHLALKKFVKRGKSTKVKPRNPTPKNITDTQECGLNTSGSIPMEVIVNKKLRCKFGELSSPANAKVRTLTPVPGKFRVEPQNSHKSTVVSCGLPSNLSFESDPSEGNTTILETAQTNYCHGHENLLKARGRDVCYVFALLDREKDEALFKCSPQLKSSEFLQQFASVIDSIASDDDLMISNKVKPSVDGFNQPPDRSQVNRGTSPISFLAGDDPSNDVQSLDLTGSPQNRKKHTEEDRDEVVVKMSNAPMLTTATKVIISKALLTFTSELKILADVSFRLLSWSTGTTGTIHGDIESDLIEDKLEVYLCHCHDKVSILIECLAVLDSKQILNMDEAELMRLWLMHDAVSCMLQAYRYIQNPSLSYSLNQQLVSLLVTCAKMILPGVKLGVSKWVSLMTMVRGIGTKLCESGTLSSACKCYMFFASLRKNRSCRVCDVDHLYQTVCNSQEPMMVSRQDNAKEQCSSSSNAAVVEQLFPRFCWFMNLIEEWSEEQFKAALCKHSVVKFSCNIHSGMFPCTEHMSEITCSCFSSETSNSLCLISAFENHSEQQEANSLRPGHKKSQSTENTVNADKNQQNLPAQSTHIVEEGLEKENDSGKNVDSEICISSSSDKVPDVVEKPDKVVTGGSLSIAETKSKNDENIIETQEGSNISSDDFTLQISDSPGETEEENGNNHQQSQQDILQQRTIKMNVDISSNHGNSQNQSSLEQKSGSKVDIDTDSQIIESSREITCDCESDSSVKGGTSSGIDYSPLNFQEAKSCISNAYSFVRKHPTQEISEIPVEGSFDAGSCKESDSNISSQQSVPESENTIVLSSEGEDETNNSDVSELMRDVSIGDDSVFEELVKEASLCGNKGSITSSEGSEDDNSKSQKSLASDQENECEGGLSTPLSLAIPHTSSDSSVELHDTPLSSFPREAKRKKSKDQDEFRTSVRLPEVEPARSSCKPTTMNVQGDTVEPEGSVDTLMEQDIKVHRIRTRALRESSSKVKVQPQQHKEASTCSGNHSCQNKINKKHQDDSIFKKGLPATSQFQKLKSQASEKTTLELGHRMEEEIDCSKPLTSGVACSGLKRKHIQERMMSSENNATKVKEPKSCCRLRHCALHPDDDPNHHQAKISVGHKHLCSNQNEVKQGKSEKTVSLRSASREHDGSCEKSRVLVAGEENAMLKSHTVDRRVDGNNKKQKTVTFDIVENNDQPLMCQTLVGNKGIMSKRVKSQNSSSDDKVKAKKKVKFAMDEMFEQTGQCETCGCSKINFEEKNNDMGNNFSLKSKEEGRQGTNENVRQLKTSHDISDLPTKSTETMKDTNFTQEKYFKHDSNRKRRVDKEDSEDSIVPSKKQEIAEAPEMKNYFCSLDVMQNHNIKCDNDVPFGGMSNVDDCDSSNWVNSGLKKSKRKKNSSSKLSLKPKKPTEDEKTESLRARLDRIEEQFFLSPRLQKELSANSEQEQSTPTLKLKSREKGHHKKNSEVQSDQDLKGIKDRNDQKTGSKGLNSRNSKRLQMHPFSPNTSDVDWKNYLVNLKERILE